MDPITIIGWACLVGVFAFSVLHRTYGPDRVLAKLHDQ